jgi:hypothetical protein
MVPLSHLRQQSQDMFRGKMYTISQTTNDLLRNLFHPKSTHNIIIRSPYISAKRDAHIQDNRHFLIILPMLLSIILPAVSFWWFEGH